MSWKNFVLPLLLLCLWGPCEEGAQACTCFPMHPQAVYCQADAVVIKAKVVGVTPGTEGRLTKYDINLIETFKGAEKLFTAIYTGPNPAACGVTLTKGVEYLLMGRPDSNASLHVHLCDFYQPWDDLSNKQRDVLYHYGEGCDCTIKTCFSFPCCMTVPTECLWTDFLPKMSNGDQAQNFACIKKRGGSCAWYEGVAHNHRDDLPGHEMETNQ
ncbi:metalloproteinase inhibitor 2-like [Hippocampus comes]|uniref:Metalloproteinase inhibitor 2-like n=1 Tax=Hippocampus comes TaxID=109280 RepID=A0A3Q2YGM8_HIPCM|nr:PREDICTED: metalloproteinase inhibitor 2-like [Hippocampus comes]